MADAEEQRSERVATDDSLRVERERTDAELVRRTAVSHEVADDVVRVARARADTIVDGARETTDLAAEATSDAADLTPGIDRERARADATLQEERASADQRLQQERGATTRSLLRFLEAERSETDDKLVGERISSDEVIAARDDFLAVVSHDLRGLLGALSFASDLVAKAIPEDPEGREARRHAATSQRIVARMTRMLDDLLDFTSIEAGRLAVIPTAGDANSLVRDVVAAFGPIATAKGIRLAAVPAPQPLPSAFDHERVLQVLGNLVSNALRFTPAPGTIEVRADGANGEVRFAVADSGVGIAADQLEIVFERFHQLRCDRRGLGLGLHISRCIVEAHRGRIWVESEPGAGSTFYFTLPVESSPPSLPRSPRA